MSHPVTHRIQAKSGRTLEMVGHVKKEKIHSVESNFKALLVKNGLSQNRLTVKRLRNS